MEMGQIFGDSFIESLKEQAKEAYLQGVEEGKRLSKSRGFGDISKAMKESGMGRAAVERLRDEGEISYIRNGSKFVYDLNEIYHYMQRNKEKSK